MSYCGRYTRQDILSECTCDSPSDLAQDVQCTGQLYGVMYQRVRPSLLRHAYVSRICLVVTHSRNMFDVVLDFQDGDSLSVPVPASWARVERPTIQCQEPHPPRSAVSKQLAFVWSELAVCHHMLQITLLLAWTFLLPSAASQHV
jgi:hypothetical protein